MTRWLVLAGFIVGCGGDSAAPRAVPVSNVVPVSGTLTYQGKALANFQVTFNPKEGGGHSASGRTDAAGKFSLGTNQPGDGAAVGTYIVTVGYVGSESEVEDTVTAMPIDDPKKMPQPPVQIPKAYSSTETSKLIQEVAASGLPDLKIDLK
jgi:hypothetical protein